MGIVLDLIVVAIIGLTAFLAAKKGFIRTLIEFVGFILAIVLAINLSSLLAGITYDGAIKPSVTESIVTSVEEAGGEVYDNLPGFVTSVLESTGVDKDDVKAKAGESSVETAERISDTVVKPEAVKVLKVAYTIPLFLVLLIAVKFLARFLNSIFKGAILGGANKVLGAVFGGAKGILYAIIFTFIALFLATMFSDGILIFSKDALSNSFICKFILSIFSINI